MSDSQTAITTFSDAPNKIVSENLKAGTTQSTWAIHGSIANQGDSDIEGFATQISTNAGQAVSFKIDTASNGFFFNISAPAEIYTLSLHDALLISRPARNE